MNMDNCKLQPCIANKCVNTEYRQVTISNEGLYTAEFSLSYIYQEKLKSYTSSKFKTHKSAALKFPEGSTTMTIVVSYFYNSYEKAFLYRESFNRFENRCYLLQGTISEPTCERLPCRCNNNLCKCNPCCICKCNYYM